MKKSHMPITALSAMLAGIADAEAAGRSVGSAGRIRIDLPSIGVSLVRIRQAVLGLGRGLTRPH